MSNLLFIPKLYSLADMLKTGFKLNRLEADIVDFQDLIPSNINYFYTKTSGLPKTFTKHWKNLYFNLINKKYIEYCKNKKPELIIIYNNQYFFPETLLKLKKKCKIVFILGDNPLWSKTFDYNLSILKYADLVITPDSHWKFELESIGLPNVANDFIGYSNKQFFSIGDIDKEINKKYQTDILFIGRNYSDSSGYKRSLFLNSFVGLNFKIFGTKEWYKWMPFFPDLSPHFNLIKNRISHEELNLALNCTKVYPIDQNTGIVNGIHLRVFETIGAGTLPVMEWRKDIDIVFKGLLPVIKNYNEAREVVLFYLNNDKKRKEATSNLKRLIEVNYTPEQYVKRLIDRITK